MGFRASGFSLIEMVVVISIISLAAPPMAVLLCQTLKDSTQSNMETQATALAKSMMEEVLSKSFEDPQSPAGSFGAEEGARINYDDVDDYDGHAQSPPTDCRGTALAAYAGFRVQVSVENVTGEAPGGAAAPDGATDYKRVTVTASWQNGGRFVRLVGLASSYDHDIDRPPVQLTFLSRQSSNNDDMTFRVLNGSDHSVYLTNLIATWGSPVAYYEHITVSAIGYVDYSTVWHYEQLNSVRMESTGNAMFNQGDLVLIPAGTTAEITLTSFRNDQRTALPSATNMRDTPFTVEIWAGPDHCVPFTVPALP